MQSCTYKFNIIHAHKYVCRCISTYFTLNCRFDCVIYMQFFRCLYHFMDSQQEEQDIMNITGISAE